MSALCQIADIAGYSITSSVSASAAGIALQLSLHSLLATTHLLVGIDQKMIEVIDPDQAEAWKFHVSNDVEQLAAADNANSAGVRNSARSRNWRRMPL